MVSAGRKDALRCVEQAQDQPIPANLVKSMILGMASLVAKTMSMPDVRSIQETLNIIQTEVKNETNITALTLYEIKDDMERTATKLQEIQESVKKGNEAKVAAREATEVGRTVTAIVREIKNNGTQNRTAPMPSYAAIASRGLATSMHNTQSFTTTPKQIQREVIVNIRDPFTIANLRAINPRSLKAHIDRAIAQSNNEHIANIKVVSSNQLKSGDLSIKTATTKEMETLRQFTDDWTHRIGNGVLVRLPTYGILAHEIRTSTMNMEKFEDIRSEMLLDNKPFIPNAEIRCQQDHRREAHLARTGFSVRAMRQRKPTEAMLPLSSDSTSHDVR
ncbi:hypothetical protein GGR55DRAFT_305475 [Xylaria sp. FL0064]|nr:hypothetical protein GGR55DRAFT_305475 [Xylaria sp. FL0064]